MNTKLERAMSMAVNIAILIVAGCFIFIVARNAILRHRAAAQGVALVRGQMIHLPGEAGPAGQKLAVVALQVGCHFCRESLPFYRQLVADTAHSSTHLVFVFPDPVDEARSYLSSNHVAAEDVRQVRLGSLHVHGTPTILLLNPDETVRNFWVGKLPAEKQAEVEQAIAQ